MQYLAKSLVLSIFFGIAAFITLLIHRDEALYGDKDAIWLITSSIFLHLFIASLLFQLFFEVENRDSQIFLFSLGIGYAICILLIGFFTIGHIRGEISDREYYFRNGYTLSINTYDIAYSFLYAHLYSCICCCGFPIIIGWVLASLGGTAPVSGILILFNDN